MLRKYFMFFLIGLVAVSQAQTMTTDAAPYYSAEVSIDSKSSEAWHRAVEKALHSVLVKVSGNKAVNSLRPAASEDATLDSMVQQFSYKSTVDLQQKEQLMLQVNFDIDMVNGLLKKLGQPIWSGKRPRTLVWFMVQKEGKNLFLTDTEPESAWFVESARARGVPVLFPTHNLAYNTVLDIPIQAPEMLSQLRAFSQAYPHDQLLIGQQVPDSGSIVWKLIIGEEEYLWSDQEPDLASAIQKGVYHVVDDMVAHNSVFQEQSMEGEVRMSIGAVHTLSAYQRLVESLRHNPVISGFYLESIAQDMVTVHVMAKGGVDALSDALAKQPELRMLTDPAAYDQVELAYQWVGK